MTKLSEIDSESNFIKAGILEHHWWGERRLPVVCNRREVMLYIERLEARLAIAVPALQSIATPALGGKAQQYTAQHALKELEQHEREAVR